MKRSAIITVDQLRVGGVILLAIGIFALAVYKLGQAANLFTKRYSLIVYLPSANGLRQGGSVTLAGQMVGTVKQIDFLPVDFDTTRNLRVVVRIDRTLQEQIRRDSEARLRTMGLLGDKVLDISPGTPRYPVSRVASMNWGSATIGLGSVMVPALLDCLATWWKTRPLLHLT